MLVPRRITFRRIALAALTLAVSLFLVHEHWIDLRTIDFDFFRTTAPIPPSDGEPAGTWHNHPVAVLHREGETRAKYLPQGQSKTPELAEAEYKRRYGRNPPPGFRQWVEYALAHKSPIIDDFDTIDDSVRRYLKYTPAEVERRMRAATANNAGQVYNDRVQRCTFSGGTFSEGCRHFAGPLTTLLGSAAHLVPDVEFLINFLDEPSVLPVPQEEGVDIWWENLSQKHIGSAVQDACLARSNGVPHWSGKWPPTWLPNMDSLPFHDNVTDTKNLCLNDYSSQHGFVMCPATMMRMKHDVPILSQAAPYPFADILYPSTHYGLKSSLYKQSHDRAWSRKKNAAYWKGSSTGGFWTESTWSHGHRQRLAALALNKQDGNITYLRKPDPSKQAIGSPQFDTYTLPYLLDSSLFNIGLTRIVGCAKNSVCSEMTDFFQPPHTRVTPDSELTPYSYRYLLDIDGNSYSGRFYRFLASRSVPLKITIFREWHDERLVPWYHYIPVSQSMDELPELMRFLATTREGEEIGRRIAEAGREWYFRALTPEHQGLYLWRLMLELAWTMNPRREAG